MNTRSVRLNPPARVPGAVRAGGLWVSERRFNAGKGTQEGMKWSVSVLTMACLLVSALTAFADRALVVPAFTAYSEPEPDTLKITAANGITGWKEKDTKIVWYGFLKSTGKLHISVKMR